MYVFQSGAIKIHGSLYGIPGASLGSSRICPGTAGIQGSGLCSAEVFGSEAQWIVE